MKTDLSYIMSMSDGNQAIVKEIIDIFSSQISEIGTELQKMESIKDYDALSKLAHKAKSSVAIMGMKTLAAKLNEFEILAKEKRNSNSYPDYINYFITESEEALKELIQFRNNKNYFTDHD